MRMRRAAIVLSVLSGVAGVLGASAVEAATPADIVIDDTYVFPESMSAARDGSIYIGSAKGIIFRAKPRASKAEPWIHPTPQNGLLSVFGVLADDRSKTLWICSAPNSLRTPPAVGTTALMAFDLRTGAQKGAYPFPAPGGICNDITVDRGGTAYASDTPGGRILKLKPGAKSLEVFAEDPRLKGIDGLVFSEDGVLYVNIVSKGQLMRVDRNADGTAGAITELTLSDTVGGPDGFRLVRGRTFLLAEGTSGRIDEVTIDGDRAAIRTLKDGLVSPPAVTLVGKTAYALEGKIRYLIDPKLKGQDPGQFKVYAIPLPPAP
jgi:sugar lactone lactonase YvrE